MIVSRKYQHTFERELRLDIQNYQNYQFYIVYYINCSLNDNYFEWIEANLKMIEHFHAEVYLIATINPEHEAELKNKCQGLNNIFIQTNSTNLFEYPGILKVWELSQQHNKPTDIILYTQSKGITHESNYNKMNMSQGVWTDILKDPELIKEIFDIFPTIDKIGARSGGIGWIWFNFWFARGSYLCRLEKPIITPRRHYYEDWLARITEPEDRFCETERCNVNYYPKTLDSCYSIDTVLGGKNIGWYYDPGDNQNKIN
jgi:hypothetical protein